MRKLFNQFAWAVTAVLCVFAVLRASQSLGTPNLVLIAAIAPLLMLVALPLLLYAFFFRRWILMVPTLVLSVVAVLWLWSDASLLGGPSPGFGPKVTVVTANINAANADPVSAFDQLAAAEVDLILLQEITPEAMASLATSAWWTQYPHQVNDARDGYYGSVILSRLPLRGEVLWVDGWPMTEAWVDLDGHEVRVINVHVVAPLSNSSVERWKAQLFELGLIGDSTQAPLIMAGDFNATRQHGPLQDLYALGFEDAFLEAGRGIGATWPNGRTGISLLRLDRIFMSDDFQAITARELDPAGSDHRPVFAELELKLAEG